MKSSNADERLKKMLTALPNREETVNLFELLQRLQDAGITFEQLAKSTIIKLEGDIKAPKVINLFVSKLNDNTTQNSLSNRAKSFDLTESEIVELANMASEHIYFGVMDEALLSSAGVLAILKRYEEMKDNADADTWFLPSERLPEDGSRVWVEYPNGVQSSYVWFRSVFFTTSYGMIIQNVQRWKPYE